MRFHSSQSNSEDSGTRSNCSPPRSESRGCPAADQSDCGADHRHSARRLRGADVGLQLRRGRRPGSTATCAALNPSAGASWSPVVITVPTGQALTINLTNNLSFRTPNCAHFAGDRGPVGRRSRNDGELSTPSPDHAALRDTTWPIAAAPARRMRRRRRERASSRSPRKWRRERRRR